MHLRLSVPHHGLVHAHALQTTLSWVECAASTANRGLPVAGCLWRAWQQVEVWRRGKEYSTHSQKASPSGATVLGWIEMTSWEGMWHGFSGGVLPFWFLVVPVGAVDLFRSTVTIVWGILPLCTTKDREASQSGMLCASCVRVSVV